MSETASMSYNILPFISSHSGFRLLYLPKFLSLAKMCLIGGDPISPFGSMIG